MMVWHTYTWWSVYTSVKLFSTTSFIDTMFCVCVCVIRASEIHSLSRFSVFNVISLLWSSCYSLDLWTYSTYSFCITTALYPLTNTYFSFLPLVTTVLLTASMYLNDLDSKNKCDHAVVVCFFPLSGLFHCAYCPPSLFMFCIWQYLLFRCWIIFLILYIMCISYHLFFP